MRHSKQLVRSMLLVWASVSLAQTAFPQSRESAVTEKLPFKVCQTSATWTRPSVDVQSKKWWSFPRYGWTADKGKSSYEWNHDFFIVPRNSASLNFDLENLTGVWSALDKNNLCDPQERWKEVDRGRTVELLILLHRVQSIERTGTLYTVTVQSTGKGFEIVQVGRPKEASDKLTFVIVNQKRQEIDRLIEGVTPWSY
ncbi:MAG: hypothetical protein HYX72_03635 [Acidobacteria bacterium]|nr:hypothetical protein [Acidobacteriota bacterium]